MAGLAFPPIVPTNLPVSTTHKTMDRNRILSLVRIPSGFMDRAYADGVAAMFNIYGGDVGSSGDEGHVDLYNFGFHKPTRSVENFQTGWSVMQAPYEVPNESGIMAAQRRGQYIYGMGSGQRSGAGAFRYQFADRFHGLYGRERRHHDNAFFYEGLGGAASGGTHDSFVITANSDLFVSDHEPPRMWFLANTTCGYHLDNGETWAWHWIAEDQRGFGGGNDSLPFYESHRFRFRFWDYYQDYLKPESHTLNPALVHPWSAGAYGDPEMWWFVPEMTKTGQYTQRLKIYRSQWKPGKYVAERGPMTLGPRWSSSDPRLIVNGGLTDKQPGDYVDGKISFTNATNLDGHSFEHDWYQDSHYVSTVGPFRGLLFGDAGGGHGNGGDVVVKVVRDPQRLNRLVLAVMTTASVFGDGWDGVWWATSNNDGDSWGRARQMVPFVHARNGYDGGPFSSVASLVITTSGHLLVPAVSSHNGVAMQSMATVNYNASEAGEHQRLRTIFRAGTGGGAV